MIWRYLYNSRRDPGFGMKDSLPSVFRFSGIKAIFSLPWKHTMSFDHDDDDFAPFLAEDLRMNLKQYVQTYFNTAKLSDSPHHALDERHRVDTVGVNKDEGGPRHESFTASVNDEDTAQKHVFVLERTGSSRPIQDTPAYCAQCPDSKLVIDTIQDALREMSANQDGPPSTSPSDPLLLSTDDGTSSSFSLPSLGQAIHTAMYSARASARSFAVEAEDTISGVNGRNLGKSVRQYDPEGLTLFHLVLIALVVHKLAPIYSLFESQCYWFANIIFDVIVAIYPSKSKKRPDPVPGPRIRFPPDYLPEEFGRFLGVTINDPRVVEAVVSVVKTRFEESQGIYKQKVIFYYFQVTIC